MPDNTPAFYTEVAPEGVISCVVSAPRVLTTRKIGDKVRYNGVVWECDVANNAYPPDVYGWRMIEEVTA